MFLSTFGFQAVDWLNEPNTALGAIMVMNIWTTAGYFMTFLARCRVFHHPFTRPPARWGEILKTFWKITVPPSQTSDAFVSIMGIIVVCVFDQIYFLIKNMRNITISYYIYKNAFEYHRMGYASAIAMVLFLIIFAITALQRKLIKEESYF